MKRDGVVFTPEAEELALHDKAGAHAAARHPSDPSLAQTEVSGSR